jgi:O-antigen/teichoic acid export membrane protein
LEGKPTGFVSNVLKLATGSAFAQGLGIVLAPFIARLFAPEAFGVAALFVSITYIIGVVACLRYDLSIVLPKTDEEGANLLGLSLFFVLIVSAAVALVVVVAGDLISDLLNSPQLKRYLWLAPIAVFVNGAFQALNYWNTRTKHFGRLSIARVAQAITTQTVKLTAGFAGYVSGGVLIVCAVLGSLVSAGFLGARVWREDRRLFRENVRWNKMTVGLKRYKKFPVYDTWSTLLNTVSRQLPTLLLAFFFSPTIVGYFTLGFALIGVPMTLLGSAIGQVFFQRSSEAHITGNLCYVVDNVFRRLVAFGLFPVLLLTVLGRDLFVVALGQRWEEAGVYVQILSPWMFFVFISSPMSTILRVLERQQTALYLDIVIFISRLLSLLIGGYTDNPRVALVLFSFSGALIYGWYSLYILHVSGVPWLSGLRSLLQYFMYCIGGVVLVLMLKLLSISSIILVVLAALLLLVYEALVVLKDPAIRLQITPLVLGVFGKSSR